MAGPGQEEEAGEGRGGGQMGRGCSQSGLGQGPRGGGSCNGHAELPPQLSLEGRLRRQDRSWLWEEQGLVGRWGGIDTSERQTRGQTARQHKIRGFPQTGYPGQTAKIKLIILFEARADSTGRGPSATQPRQPHSRSWVGSKSETPADLPLLSLGEPHLLPLLA